MQTIHFENQYDKGVDSVFLEYLKQGPPHKDFLEVNEAVITCFEKFTTQKFVADIRKMGIISLESQQWVAEVLLPKLIKQLKGKPLIHAQLLDEKDIMVKISANGVKQKNSENNR